MMSHTIYMYICIYIMYHAYDYDAPNLTDLSPRQHEIWDNCKSPRTIEVENEDCFYSSTIKWLMEKTSVHLRRRTIVGTNIIIFRSDNLTWFDISFPKPIIAWVASIEPLRVISIIRPISGNFTVSLFQTGFLSHLHFFHVRISTLLTYIVGCKCWVRLWHIPFLGNDHASCFSAVGWGLTTASFIKIYNFLHFNAQNSGLV